MFRQTLIRAAQARGLVAGATNLPNKTTVEFSLCGPPEKVDEIAEFIAAGKKMNSWGAHATAFEELEDGRPLAEHQVTTANVDSFKWNPKVKFYL